MKYLEPKAPENTKFYVIDYTRNFNNDVITSLVITTLVGTVITTRVIPRLAYIGFMLSGGAVDEVAELSIYITTASGQTLHDKAQIQIIEDEESVDYSVVTKQTIVEYAFQDLRLSGYTFDHTANETSAMLSRLDALMREYRGRGINTNYNMPKQIGLSNLNDIAGIDDCLALSIATLVACSYMDGIGKTYTPNLIKKQNDAFNFVYAYCKDIPNRILPAGTPKGAGGKLFSVYAPFFLDGPTTVKGVLLNIVSGQFISAGVWDESVWG